MICHEFKGGIGTASRMVSCPSGTYTVGALVQANYGDAGRPAGGWRPSRAGDHIERVPSARAEPPGGSSIIVIIATDAPLVHSQCKRLAQRATIGLARVGGMGYNGSGDIFLAFATGNQLGEQETKAVCAANAAKRPAQRFLPGRRGSGRRSDFERPDCGGDNDGIQEGGPPTNSRSTNYSGLWNGNA